MSKQPNLVVVGVDGSTDSMAALKWAAAYAHSTDAALRVVTAWSWPVSYGAPLFVEGYDPAAEAATTLDEATAELGLPADRIETICREGNAGPVLVSESEDAALLVVGSRGHSVISSVLLGSTSHYCVHHAVCAVAIIR